ncbi:MAG: methionyl-tRNA formyltransferase [Verrucomicrobia bacterium]|nr:methionyl-tRNA formyltransferase [Verrucomicrobiota bacterium]
MNPLRIVFMGTAPLACASLEALTREAAFSVVGVVTQPDRPKGRDLRLQPSAVKELALQKELPVLQPEKARNEDFVQALRAWRPDLIVVAAYGQLLPTVILDLPRFHCVNVHTSLLPKYRGAAPIQWAILNGDAETGVTIMQMEAGLDTGPVLSREVTPIRPDDNAQTLHDRLAALGAQLLGRTIPDYVAGRITPEPQPAEGASYARKITKEDGRLDWSQPARALWNRVRGLTPWPGTFTFMPADTKRVLLKVWEARPLDSPVGTPGQILQADKSGLVVACGEGALQLLCVQREGSRRMTAAEFLAGHPLRCGEGLVSSWS